MKTPAELAACKIYGKDFDIEHQGGMTEAELVTIIQQALSDSLRPYRGMPARLGLIAVALNKSDPEAARLIAEIARELEALINREAGK